MRLNRRKELGNVSIEHLVVLGTVALLGTAGIRSLGHGVSQSIDGDSRVATAVASVQGPMAVSQAAGMIEKLATVARDVGEWGSRTGERASRIVERNPLKHLDGVQIPWDAIEPRHVMPALDWAMAKNERRYKGIVSRFRPKTYRTTVHALEHASDEVDSIFKVLNHLDGVTDNPELSAAFDEARAKIMGMAETAAADTRDWETLQKYAGTRRAGRLTGEKKRYFDQVMESYVKGGANLPEEQRVRLAQISTEVVEAQQAFGRNVAQAQKDFEWITTDASKLEGLTDVNIERAAASAKAVGKEGYRFTLFDGTARDLLTFAEREDVRHEIWSAISSIGTSGETDNRPLIETLLRLRREQANILGFKDYVDFITHDRMAKTGEAAQAFIDDLAAKTRAQFDRENEAYRAFRVSQGGPADLMPWNDNYWMTRWSNSRGGGAVKLEEYFEMGNVMQGVFTTAERLYGIKFEEIGAAKWVDGVKTFKVTDETGRHLGNLQFDLLGRPGKRDGAWMAPVKTGVGKEPSLGIVEANFGPAKPGRPVLLSVGEVETAFHEVGHALHLLMSEAKVRSLAGTNVAWDFVELPSQFMENFVWEDATLDFLAKHYETGEGMPEHLRAYLKGKRNAGIGTKQMFQLSNASVDLALHRIYDPAIHGDAVSFARKVADQFSRTAPVDEGAHIASFTHIFSGGYAGGYYGYKWSEVLDADVFSRFKENGVFNRNVGEAFRRTLLSQGDVKDPGQLFRDFMGRDPDSTALLRRQGLAQ